MTKLCATCGPSVGFDDSEDICPRHGAVLASPPSSSFVTNTPTDTEKEDGFNRNPLDTRDVENDFGQATQQVTGEDDSSTPSSEKTEPPVSATFTSTAKGTRPVQSQHQNRSTPASETNTESPKIWDKFESFFGKAEPILPLELSARYKITGPMTHLGYTEAWPVTSASSGQKAYFLRHKVAPITSEAVYDQIQAASEAVGYGLIAHGVVQVGGVNYKYELIQYQRAGESFSTWLCRPDGQPSESRAIWLLEAICAEVSRWEALSIQPLHLHPNTLAVSSDGVSITDFSCMHAIPVDRSFIDKFGLLAPKLAPFAAPELLERREVGPTSLVFSMGQLVWQAMLGTPLEYGVLRNATAIPFQGIDDSKLARQLMGALFPDPELRWSLEQLIAADSKLPPWSKLHPDSATTSFAIGGEHFWRAEDALEAAVLAWDESSAELDPFLQWLATTRHANLARAMQKARKQENRSADWVLVRLQHVVRPGAPILWRQYCLDEIDKTLTAMGQAALAQGEHSNAARADVQRLIAANLRGAII